MTQPATAPPPLRRTDLAVFLLFLLVCGVFLAAGSLVTAPAAAGWYQTLQRPAFAPPDTVFAPAWTAIFLLMAVAGWRVWRRAGWTAAQAVFGLQLLLNFGWSALFFGLQRPDLARLAVGDRGGGDIVIVEGQLAAGRRFQPQQHLGEGGLAAA